MLPPLPPARRLAADETADWVVLGAGLTGLAAARRLARHLPEARVILLEAHRVGYGTSGRNSGFVIDTPHFSERGDRDHNRRLTRIVRAGAAQLREVIREHNINCGWSETGHLIVVVGDKGVRVLEQVGREMDDIGETYRWLDRDALSAEIGTAHYRAAVHTPGTVLMQPAALARGLGQTLPANVDVFEDSPARAVHPGTEIRIECDGGSVKTRNLLLTSNAFTPGLGFLGTRLFPILLYASLTRPLNGGEQVALDGDNNWGLVPALSGGTTMRRTPDNRILVRNTVRYGADLRIDDARRRAVRANHTATLRSRFPALRDVSFDYTWAGVICMTMNKAAVFGSVAPGIFASVGYNGVGVARGTASGALLADLAVGADSELLRDVQALPEVTRLPPKPILGLGVRARIAYYHWFERGER
jgi:glycine/D-amino acid oxidase-like deaminating enzyme